MININKRVVILTSTAILILAVISSTFYGTLKNEGRVSSSMIDDAASVIGLEFTRSEKDSMVGDLNDLLDSYESLRALNLPNSLSPAFGFNPVLHGMNTEKKSGNFRYNRPDNVKRPQNLEEVAFWTVAELAELIRTRQVTYVELTNMYLGRLRKYGPILECVVTLTDELALEQARRADAEIASGNYRVRCMEFPGAQKIC